LKLENTFEDDDAGSVMNSEAGRGALSSSFHFLFVTFMTISALSMWISFLPGIGRDTDAPSPSLHNVEEHMNTKGTGGDADPIVCVAFSISASEPRMMILRNLVGKLMAWCHEHKIFLKERPWDKRPEAGGVNRFNIRDNSKPLDKVQFVDLFQDEGNRVGCYALWDSFAELIDGADLKFIEGLANEMRNMTAADKVLKSNKMPVKKYIEREWSADKCTRYILKGLKGNSDDSTAKALRGAQLDGNALLALLDSGKAHSLTIGRSAEHGDKLQSVLQDLGICQLLQLQRIRVIAQEIVDKIKSYEPGE
jgi:hypothetical protein